jgi:hypothetical protein
LIVLLPIVLGSYQGTVVQERVDLEVVEQIRTEGMDKSHLPDDIRYLTEVIGPRLTGSPAMRRANEWVAAKMTEYGLTNVHHEGFDFGRGWEEVSYFGRMVEPFIKPLSGRSMAWAGGTMGRKRGPAIIVDRTATLEQIEALGDRLRGAWLLQDEADEPRDPRFDPAPLRTPLEELLAPPPPPAPPRQQRQPPSDEARAQMLEDRRRMQEQRRQVSEALENSGALGFLRRSGRLDGIIRGGSGGSRTPGDPPGMPQIMLADEDYSLIYRNAADGVPVTLEFDIENRFIEDDDQAYNTIGEIGGTDLAEQVVMLGGHLDSWHMGGGATDNASGSVVMHEAVRIIKALGLQPRRTIRIALWAGEEQGLIGSREYVQAHADEHRLISAYLNVDNGTGKLRGIRTQSNPHAVPIFEQLLWPFRDLGVVAVRNENAGGTDHLSFDRAGIPGFNFIQDPVEYGTKTHHTNVDTYDALLLEDLQQAAVVVASTVYHLAMRDEMFPRKAAAPMGGGGR